MEFCRKMSEAASLVSGMAARLEIDVAERTGNVPDLQANGFAAVVMRCTGCPKHDDCAALQAANPKLDAPPEYCRNKELFTKG